MSTSPPWLDRFVKWFFNSSTTAHLDPFSSTLHPHPRVQGDSSGRAVGGSRVDASRQDRPHSTARRLTPFSVGQKGLR